jgi:hypothetical protein
MWRRWRIRAGTLPILLAGGLRLAAGEGVSAPSGDDRRLARDILQELVEIPTTESGAGSTPAAEAVALRQCQSLSRGAREASRGRWCEGEAGCNRAILAGRESPRSGHWPRDRDFVGGVGTRPTVVHTDIGGCAEGARHVVDVLVVAEAGFFPAHDDVGTHKCGGDFPDEVGIGSQGHGPCHYEGRKYGGQLPFGQDSSPQYAARFPCGMTIGIVVRTNLRVVTAAPRRWRRAGFRQNRRARSQPSRAPTRLFALGAPRGARSRHGVLRQGHGEAVLSVEGERPFAERRRAGQPPSWWRQPSQYSARAGPFRARAACSGGIRLFVAMH